MRKPFWASSVRLLPIVAACSRAEYALGHLAGEQDGRSDCLAVAWWPSLMARSGTFNDAESASATASRSESSTLSAAVAGRCRRVGVGVAPLRVHRQACRGPR